MHPDDPSLSVGLTVLCATSQATACMSVRTLNRANIEHASGDLHNRGSLARQTRPKCGASVTVSGHSSGKVRRSRRGVNDAVDAHNAAGCFSEPAWPRRRPGSQPNNPRPIAPRTDGSWPVKSATPSRASWSLGWLRSSQWGDRCGQRRINLVQEPGAPDGPAMGRGRPWPSPSCRLLGSPAHASRARDPPRRPLAASSAASPGWRRRQQAKFATLSHPTAQRRRWYHGV